MKNSGTATRALVLKRFDYSENSQIARLYTRELGRVSVLAKGIRRPNPDLLGPLDLFALAETSLRPKSGDALSLLTRYRVVTGFPGIRSSLEKLAAAFYLAELLCEGVRDFDPDARLFDLWTASFAALEAAPDAAAPSIVVRAELGYLELAGFAPSFDRCVSCGTPAPSNALVRYSPGRGGVVCAKCLDPATPGLVELNAGRRRTLLALAATDPARAHVVRLRAADLAVLRRLFDRTLEATLEKELKSAAFLLRVW